MPDKEFEWPARGGYIINVTCKSPKVTLMNFNGTSWGNKPEYKPGQEN